MIEYRTERVNPQYVNEIIETLATFGWVVVSSQEIYNESTEVVGVEVKSYGDGFIGGFMSGFTGKDGSINVKQRKNVTNYTVVQFARDTDMPNYEKLKRLNAEFESKLGVPEPKKPIIRTAITAIGMLLIIASVIMAIAGASSAEIWEIVVCVVFPVAMIPLTVMGWIFYKRKLRQYDLAQIALRTIYSEALELNA